MFAVVAGAAPGVLSPDTRKQVIRSSVRYCVEELRAMPATLPEMPAEQLAELEAALLEAQGAIDVFRDQVAGAVGELADALKVPL